MRGNSVCTHGLNAAVRKYCLQTLTYNNCAEMLFTSHAAAGCSRMKMSLEILQILQIR